MAAIIMAGVFPIRVRKMENICPDTWPKRGLYYYRGEVFSWSPFRQAYYVPDAKKLQSRGTHRTIFRYVNRREHISISRGKHSQGIPGNDWILRHT
jgi:hypothetical protein